MDIATVLELGNLFCANFDFRVIFLGFIILKYTNKNTPIIITTWGISCELLACCKTAKYIFYLLCFLTQIYNRTRILFAKAMQNNRLKNYLLSFGSVAPTNTRRMQITKTTIEIITITSGIIP